VALLLVDEPHLVHLFDSVHAPARARAAVLALLALLALVVSSHPRIRDRLGYERWRLVHIVLAVVLLGASFVHVVLVARFTDDAAMRWGSFAMVALAAVALFYLRVARPFARGWQPYVLERVEQETPTAATLVLRADGHGGMVFAPGQFAWLKLADSRYSLREHPFSIASSAARPEELRFTIRSAGDFTGTVADLAAGTRVLVDGPHGTFVPATDRPLICVVGGAGVTPVLSFVATAADRGTPMPLQVVYGCRSVDDVIGAATLRAAEQLPDVSVELVPSDPPAGWAGASGFVTAALLERLAGGAPAERGWFLCGPPPMLRAVEAALRELGVPSSRIQVESF
jgi:3-phenylpropionate/trans-cinnamate dioxygenase ferredoxin reductase subunit